VSVPAHDFFKVYRAALEEQIRSHLDEADRSDDAGDHVGFARHHRALASGVQEAIHLLDEMWRRNTALSASPEGDGQT